jgi:hypothetical protein
MTATASAKGEQSKFHQVDQRDSELPLQNCLLEDRQIMQTHQVIQQGAARGAHLAARLMV